MRWKTRFIPFRVGQPFRIGRTVSLWVLSASAFDRSTTYVQGHYFPLPAALQDSRMLRATSRRSIGDATETSIADSSGLRLAGLRIHPFGHTYRGTRNTWTIIECYPCSKLHSQI